MNRIIGIDPGKHGSAVLYNGLNFAVKKFHKNEIGGCVRRLLSGDLCIIIEKVNAFAMQGRVSIFTFGRMLGQIEGACQYAGYAKYISYATPRTWQEHFGLLEKRPKGMTPHEKYLFLKNHKLKLLKKAKKYYPLADLDTADAILIARYGWELQKSA